MTKETHKKRLFLIDGSSYIYRAFFAIPPLTNSRGLPTNAVYGYTSMLIKIIKDHNPDYLAVAFDAKGPTFRHEAYKDYKANRPSMPDDLQPQIPYIHELTAGFNLPVLSMQGVEADDIIGTIARQAAEHGLEVIIVTGDKDMMQLVSHDVSMLDTMKDKITGPSEVMERYNAGPDKVRDIMGLMGDTSDNIPGVAGVGEKTAIKLISEYGSMEGVYENIDSIKGKLKEKLERDKDIAFLSRELVTIDCKLDFNFCIDEYAMAEPDLPRLRELYKELELTRFLKEMTPQKTLSRDGYKLLDSLAKIEEFLGELPQDPLLSIDLETTSLDTLEAKIVGISLSFEPHKAFYIPVGHSYLGVPEQPDLDKVMELLKPLLISHDLRKTGHNLKYDYSVLKNYGISMKGIYCDTMIASYLLHPTRHSHSLEEIAREHLDHQMITYKEMVGDPKKVTFDTVKIEDALNYGAEDADVALLIANDMLPMLERDGINKLFHEIEIPLIEVLADMEMTGVKVDTTFLATMSGEVERDMNLMEGKIYEIAGEAFNINSPKQLAVILFEKLGLPAAKKTKTGYSTNVDVLMKLADKHELPAMILEYRSLSKLKSTYIDALPRIVKEKTGRVHTSYNQTVTSTGRLSSSEPNLQNIPIKTELGKKIREAFVPEAGSVILAADYSQVELRLMAHLSEDDLLLKAFERGEDIHTRTAAEVFGIFPQMVTPQMRREAKVINFGILYGMSGYGLARELGCSPKIANAYIEGYFNKYRGIKAYMESIVIGAKEKGYVSTIMDRRCYLPEINSANGMQRQFAERAAVNAPLQGSAADIIKVAMVNIHRRLIDEGLKSKMIMQVHDELVFEIPEEELDLMKRLVAEEMEGVIELKAPLVVDIGIGANWAEAH